MIVISGALVLVALVLLIIGLVSTSLPFVYASIAVSVVSFVFLLIGILQRRNEQLPEDAAADAAPARSADVEGVTAIIPAGSSRAQAATEPAAAEASDAPVEGSVLVVSGRPRYHVEGCRYLTGKEADEVSVSAARDEGFTACGVCKPDAVLAEEAAAQPHPQPDEDVPTEPVAEIADIEPAEVPDPVTAARKTTRATPTKEPGRTPAVSKTAPAARKAAAAKAPAKAPARTTAAKAPAKKAPAKKAAPSKAAAAAIAGTPAAASAARKPGSVVVIPDRGKFHTAECRYVRGVDGAQELSRAAAARQGYDACGVCKP